MYPFIKTTTTLTFSDPFLVRTATKKIARIGPSTMPTSVEVTASKLSALDIRNVIPIHTTPYSIAKIT